MSTDNQRLIQAARKAFMEAKRQSAVSKRSARNELERLEAEVKLTLDDIRLELGDAAMNTPMGRAVIMYVLSRKLVKQVDTDLDLEDFPPGW
jgi:hypothetical protein